MGENIFTNTDTLRPASPRVLKNAIAAACEKVELKKIICQIIELIQPQQYWENA